MHRSVHRYRTRLFSMLFILLFGLTACQPGPKPTIRVVYGTSGARANDPTDTRPDLFIELMSPTNCIEMGVESIFIMIIKNANTYTVTLEAGQQLDMALSEGYDMYAPKHLWSQSPDYPATISSTFAPGEERMYKWQWRADTTAKEGMRVLNVVLDVGRAPNPHELHRTGASVELYVGTMPWNVGGYAGSIPISCTDVLRHTGQINNIS